MSIDLSHQDKINVLHRVRIVNDYYVTLSHDINALTKLKKQLTSHDMAKYNHVHELLADYPNYREYAHHTYGSGNDNVNQGHFLDEAFTLPTQYLSDSKRNGLQFHYDYDMKIKDAYRSYQKMLVGTIYSYLYRTYGQSIPPHLLNFVDFSGILYDSQRILICLDHWWQSITSQSITVYTQLQNQAKTKMAHHKYIQKIQEQITWLVQYNHFRLNGKDVLHVSHGKTDLGIKTLLGSDAINAILFYGTYYLGMRLTSDLFHDHDYPAGEHDLMDNPDISIIRSYKNHNFAIKFSNPRLARKIYQELVNIKSNQFSILNQKI